MKEIIKKIFHPGINTSFESIGLLMVRIIVGAFMLTHGFGKLMMLLGGNTAMFPDPIGIGATASLFLIVLAKFYALFFLILV
jgi:putative oxidoreductase